MMFGAKSGGGFGGAIDYDRDLDGRHDKDARILDAEGVDVFYNTDGQLDADSRQLARSFRAQALTNPDVKKCVKHLWVSYMPEDLLAMVNNEFKGKQHFNILEDAIDKLGQQRVNEITDTAMVEDTRKLLQEMKYDNTQFLIVRHSEKDNPHVHVIVNMVDNDGNRLKDFQEKKRGIKFCKLITLDRNYTWGEHKSVSTTVSNNPKDVARYAICQEMFEISKICHAAGEMINEAARRGIQVKLSTNYQTGRITGISFAKDGYLFPASRVDTSLTAKKLFPSQVSSSVSLSELPAQAQNIVKSGGVVDGFNNQGLIPAKAPDIPKTIKESQVREEYHKAIGNARSSGSRTAYVQNIAGLALDPECGPAEKRAEAISPYIKDESTGKTAEIENVLEVIRIADDRTRRRESLFSRYLEFLRELLKKSLNMKGYPIAENENKDIHWSDIIGERPGENVRLARDIQTAVHEAQEKSRQRAQEKKEAEASRHQAYTQPMRQSQTTKSTGKRASNEERSNGYKIKI